MKCKLTEFFRNIRPKGRLLPGNAWARAGAGGAAVRLRGRSCASSLSAASGCPTGVPHRNPLLGFRSVLVHSSCSNKIASSRCLLNNRTYFSQGSPRSRRRQIWCLLRACLPVQRRHLVAMPSRGGQDERALRRLFTRALMLFVRTPLL